MQENNFDNSNTTFYSDSFNDLPLLEAVNKPIVVDGDDKLIEEAKKNDWQYISFR
jgi:phosphoserine phosphatase